MASRCLPFPAKGPLDLARKIKTAVLEPLPGYYSKDLMDAIRFCLEVDPSRRIDSSQLLNVLNIKVSRAGLELRQVNDELRWECERHANTRVDLRQAEKKIRDLTVEVREVRNEVRQRARGMEELKTMYQDLEQRVRRREIQQSIQPDPMEE